MITRSSVGWLHTGLAADLWVEAAKQSGSKQERKRSIAAQRHAQLCGRLHSRLCKTEL